MTSIHDLHALRLMPSPFSSVPQLAQLIDCIVICHVSAVSRIPQGVSCCCRRKRTALPWRKRRKSEDNSPPVEKEKRGERRGERAEFYFGGNFAGADRGLASTSTTTQQQGVNALYQCLLIKSSLSRYCTNHGREPVEQYSESLSLHNLDHRNIF